MAHHIFFDHTFFRFIGLLFRFWYITLPVILLIYYNVRKKIQIIQAQFFGSSGQETQETEDEIIDADFIISKNLHLCSCLHDIVHKVECK